MEKLNRGIGNIEKLEIPLDDIPEWLTTLREGNPSYKLSLREIDGMLTRISPEYNKIGDRVTRLKVVTRLEQFLRDTNVEKMSEKEKGHKQLLLETLREELHGAIKSSDKG